jgi:hypothetical protein
MGKLHMLKDTRRSLPGKKKKPYKGNAGQYLSGKG